MSSMTEIPVSEAAKKLGELSELASVGQTFGLLKDGRLVALLSPPPQAGKARTGKELADRMAEWPPVGTSDAERFAADVEDAVREGNKPSGDLDWAS
jgi:hypothetical protein